MKFKILIFFLFIGFFTFSQNSNDSLINIAEKSNSKIEKAKTYLKLAQNFEHSDTIQCFKYVNIGISLANQINNNKLLAKLYFSKAHAYDFFKYYLKSKNQYLKCVEYALAAKDTLILARSFLNIGATQYYYGEPDKALKNYKNSLKYFMQLKDSIHIAKSYNNIALIYKTKGNYVKSINNFQKSLKINEKLKNKESVAKTYQNIGVLYWEQKNNKQAIECYNKAVKIYNDLNDKVSIGDIYTNLGIVYKAQNKNKIALKYYENAVLIYKQTENKQGLATAISNKAILYDKSKNYKQAEKDYKQSLKIFKEISYKRGIQINLLNLSMLYSTQNKHNKAIEFAKKALKISTETKNKKDIYEAYKTLANNYANSKQYDLAYKNILKYISIKDTLFNLEKNKQINEIQTKYETEKKETKILLLEKKDKIQKLKIEKSNQTIKAISIITSLAVIFVIILLVLFVQKRKSYIALVEHNVELAKLDIKKEKYIQQKNLKKAEITPKKEITKTKYSKSFLSEEQKKELLQNITSLMEIEKYFLNAHFTVDEFAKKLKTNRGYISQIINENFNTNFNNFVNEYRVKQARKFLISSEYDNYSLEGIASLVGFNTRATFNSAFKKFTGVTPSFFKQNSRNKL